MNSILGKRIRNLRENEGISQKELAKKLNISNSTLSQYENNIRVPSDEIKILIANYFDVSLDYLLGSSDIRNPYVMEIDSQESKDQLVDGIMDLLIETGQITQEEVELGEVDDEKARKLLDKIEKAIKISQILED